MSIKENRMCGKIVIGSAPVMISAFFPRFSLIEIYHGASWPHAGSLCRTRKRGLYVLCHCSSLICIQRSQSENVNIVWKWWSTRPDWTSSLRSINDATRETFRWTEKWGSSFGTNNRYGLSLSVHWITQDETAATPSTGSHSANDSSTEVSFNSISRSRAAENFELKTLIFQKLFQAFFSQKLNNAYIFSSAGIRALGMKRSIKILTYSLIVP